jgi:alanine racemase
VAYSKVTQPGRSVSYGSLWQVEGSPTRVVTIPCGYADGYFRRMTNQARVIINGRKYPQVGRICMDQFMVDVGDDDVKVGDEVVLLGGGHPRRKPCGLDGHERIRSDDEHQRARAEGICEWGTIGALLKLR